MKAQSAILAIVALLLWLIPSGSLAQGKSGKSRLTICHVPPGNPNAGNTLTIPEQAWRAHEAHGDYLGPCEGYSEGSGGKYGDDTQRAKKGKKAKKKDGVKSRSGSDVEDADEGIGADDRADEGEEVDAADSGSGETEVDQADTRTRREKRQAERRAQREQRIRDRDGKTADDGETVESATSGDAEAAEAGGAAAGTDATKAAERRAQRKARAAERRAAQGTQPDAETEAPPAEEQGFVRSMKQFFGFGGDEAAEPSGEVAE